MKHLTVILLLLLLGPVSHGAGPDPDDLPHVRADGKRLMFGWHGGSPHRVDVSNLVRMAALDTVKVLTAQTNGDVDYFVLTVSGPSRTGSPAGSTSGTTESNLLWLKLKAWKLMDAQAMPYQSYWDSLQPVGDYHIKGGVLTLRFANLRESTNYVLRYDSSKPDGKIEIQRASDVD